MTDPVDTDALRFHAAQSGSKLASFTVWGMTSATLLRSAADEVDRLRAENATWQKQWTDTLVAATDWYTQTQQLRAVIENAPHREHCRPHIACTCWKADAL